jgi:hypothetical protein
MGQTCYPVIVDHIDSTTNSIESDKVFSKSMNLFLSSCLIPYFKTSAYYNELVPLADSIQRLRNSDLGKAGKRTALAVIRSVFQTGTSDKIKACLDIRVPKHIISFVQDNDPEVRHEAMLIFLKISEGILDEDFEIMASEDQVGTDDLINLNKRQSKKSAFSQHKSMSMSAYFGNAQEENTVNKDSKSRIPTAEDLKKTKKGTKVTEANYIG